jgi:hypothetical protein
MRKILNLALAVAGAFLFALLGPSSARAQFTTVTATVQDPNGIPYSGAIMNAILVPGASGGYRLGGQPYSGRVGPVTLDINGSFTAQFGDVTLITPGSPQWQITIDSAAATILPSLGTGPQSFTYTSSGTTISGSSPVSLTSALNALAPKLTNFAGAGTGTIAGTVTAFHIPYASAANTLADIAGSAVTGATGAIALTAGADTTKPLTINSHSATQSATELDVNNQSSTTADTPVTFHGLGFGSFTAGAGPALFHMAQESQTLFGWVLTNHTADVAKGTANLSLLEAKMHDDGTSEQCGGAIVADAGNSYSCLYWGNPAGSTETITARTVQLSGVGTIGTIVPFRVQGTSVQSADLLQFLNSSGNTLSAFDSAANLYFNGSSSGTAKIGVAAAAGTPCTILLPITSPTAGQVLSSAAPSAGNCQTSWAANGGGVASFSGDGTIITNSASTGAVTASIAGTSGGWPYFNSATSWASSGVQAANVLVKGGGVGAGPSGSSLTDNGTAITGTEPFRLANGSVSAPSYSFSGSTTDGWFERAANVVALGLGGTNEVAEFFITGWKAPSGAVIAWTSSASASGSDDTGISRIGAGIVGVGTGTAGNVAGALESGTYLTGTNCKGNGTAANPSVASCGSSAAGMFSCATNASTGTCQVNTTAVTANSEISITQNAADGGASQLNVTCNTGNVLPAAAPILASKSAGTSFTINLGTVTTNPACFEYIIVN